MLIFFSGLSQLCEHKFYLGKIMRDEQLTEVVSGEKQQECREVICIVSV